MVWHMHADVMCQKLNPAVDMKTCVNCSAMAVASFGANLRCSHPR